MAEWSIDTKTFAFFVHAYRTIKLEMTMREAQAESGISLSTFNRAETGQKLSVANTLALCLWMDANPYWFLIDPRTGKRIVEPPEARVSRESTETTAERLTSGEPAPA